MNIETHNNPIVIYENMDGTIKVDVRVLDESVWLSLNQMAEIFGRDKSVISRHLKNIFAEEELGQQSTVAFFATVQKEGGHDVTRQIEYYNFDAILSVGYRVNSKRGVQFRKWASNVLKEYLLQGYSLNKDKMIDSKIKELQSAINLISNTMVSNELLRDAGVGFVEIIKAYSKTWDLLIKYDEDRLILPQNLHTSSDEIISYDYAKASITKFKEELGVEGLFGKERDDALRGILGNLMQSFAGVDLYPSIEEKAAHLLYFVIKDHPFSDGNKRIGSFLFLLYLKMSAIDLNKMNENTITALALLVAESDAKQKDLMIKLIMNTLV